MENHKKNSHLSIVILAAGKGTRMHSNTPKVLHKICGKEMLYYSIKESLHLSDDVCVILGFKHADIQDKMQEYFTTAQGDLRLVNLSDLRAKVENLQKELDTIENKNSVAF